MLNESSGVECAARALLLMLAAGCGGPYLNSSSPDLSNSGAAIVHHSDDSDLDLSVVVVVDLAVSVDLAVPVDLSVSSPDLVSINCGTLATCGSQCVNLQTDAAHCGACGSACAVGQSCSVGKCCPSGQINCGGICVATQSDPNHCGGCNIACSSGQNCISGLCCAVGLSNCGGGGCVNTISDPQNCGYCGHNCGSGQCDTGHCSGSGSGSGSDI